MIKTIYTAANTRCLPGRSTSTICLIILQTFVSFKAGLSGLHPLKDEWTNTESHCCAMHNSHWSKNNHMWVCRGTIQVSRDSPELSFESPPPSKCLRANWDNCPEAPGVSWPGPYPTPTGMGIDHWAPGTWTLSGHPGLLVPGTERLRLGTQPLLLHSSVSIHPKRLSACQCWAWAWGYRGELRSCPQGNRHWESSVRRPKP